MGSLRPLLVILSALAVLGGLGWLVTGGPGTTPKEPTTSSPAPAGPGTRSADRTQDLIHEQAEEGDRPGRLEDAGEDEPEERGRVADQRLRLARVRTREERRAFRTVALEVRGSNHGFGTVE